MRNIVSKSVMLMSIIILPTLFSCVTAQKRADVYNERGIECLERLRLQEAIDNFTMAIRFDPSFAEAYNNRAGVYMKRLQYDHAISDYSKAIELKPRFSGFYLNRAKVYYLRKEYDKSWDDIKKAQELGLEIPSEFLEELRKASGREK